MGGSWITIDARRLAGNVAAFRARVGGKTALMAVVKANAYGHGAALVAPLLAPEVDWFGVDSIDEARELQDAGVQKPILVLGYVDPDDSEDAVRRGLRLALFRGDCARALARAARKLSMPARVHVKVETGLHRLGATVGELDLSGLEVEGVYTHFADVEDPSSTFYREQLERLNEAASVLGNVIVHASPTAGALLHDEARLDLARVGIGLYGIWPSSASRREDMKLAPVLSWRARLAQVKTVPKGETVGYDLTFRAESAREIGIVPAGYYDGYDRKLSNRGYVLVGEGRGKAPVVGRVAMNMFMVDVTGLGAKDGDEVTLLGDGVPAETLAELTDTIAYEIVARLNPRLRREVLAH